MATQLQQRKLKQLFEASMAKGGFPEFQKNWSKSIGIETVEVNGGEGPAEVQRYEQASDQFRDNHRDTHSTNASGAWQIGEVMSSLVGPRWKERFEQTWKRASQLRFEGFGSDIMTGDIPYVSAGLDVVAGLLNARALARAKAPEWIWDKMCTVQEAVGEGGFDIGTRILPTKQEPFNDLADGQSPPTRKIVSTRVHRNRTLRQAERAKVNYWTFRNDLTGQAAETVDELSVIVLAERERKVADAVMGVSTGTTLGSGGTLGVIGNAVPMIQDGLAFFPYQTGIYGASGANANAVNPAPENGVVVANFANDGTSSTGSGGDGAGLTNYLTLVRALQTMHANRDPFTLLPPNFQMTGMQFLVAPAGRVQLEELLQAKAIWQIANFGFNPGIGAAGTVGTATVSDYNLVEKFGLDIIESQFWFNRLTDAGLYKVGADGTAYHVTLTNSVGDSFNTAGSIMSAYFMGHYRESVVYWTAMPFNVVDVPLGSVEFGEQTILVKDFHERGFPYWKNPRQAWRTWA